MDEVALLQQRLRESEQRNEALQSEFASLRAEFAAFRRDHEALGDAARVLMGDRDLLRHRVAELEVSNKRLVDMLWGRRSERRSESSDQMQLSFSDDPANSPSVEQQAIITAQTKADEAFDLELLRRLAARRKARREKQGRNRSRQLDVPWPSPRGNGPAADVQCGQQCAPPSSDDRGLFGGCVAEACRRPAEPSDRPCPRLARLALLARPSS